MSCGVPVVATDVGSVAESVRDGETGFLAPAGDEVSLATRVQDLLLEPLHAQTLGDAGRRHVVEHASIDVMVGGYESLLENLYRLKTGKALAPKPAEASAAARSEPAPVA